MSDRSRINFGDWPEFTPALRGRSIGDNMAILDIIRRAMAAAGHPTRKPMGTGARQAMSQPEPGTSRIEMPRDEYFEFRALFPDRTTMVQAVADALADYLGIPRIVYVQTDPRFRAGDPPRMPKKKTTLYVRSSQPRKRPEVRSSAPDVPRWPRGYELRHGHLTGRPYLARISRRGLDVNPAAATVSP